MKSYDWLLTEPVVLLEGYQPPMYPQLEYEPEYAAELVEKTGAGILRFPAMSNYAYYPTRHYINHPQLKGRDLLKETIAACHKKGIKVIPYIPVGHAFMAYDADIEPYNSWAKLDENGNRFPWWQHGYLKLFHLCLNSPYREAIKKIVEEIVTNYDVDGIYFDGPYQDCCVSGEFCHCPSCREAYFKKTGKNIPPNSDKRNWNDPELTEYLSWVINDVKGGIMRELNSIIKKKDIPHLFNNCGWLSNKYWGGDRYRDIDGFMFEGVHTSQEKLLHVMLGRSTGKYIWSYLGSYQATQQEHLVTDIPGCADYAGIPAYGEELKNEGFSVIAGNAAPIYYGLNRIYYQQDTVPIVKDVFDFTRNNRELLQKVRNKRFIGIWTSGYTRDWWFKNEPWKNSKYRYFFYGGFNVLKDRFHQAEPFYMSEMNNADLNQYRIVFLPNAACMSDYEVDAVKRYVAEGGCLIATFMTSLFDEKGNRRDNFALADLFGADLIEKNVGIRRDSYIRITKAHPVTDGFKIGQLMPQDLQFLTVKAHNDDDVAAMTSGIGHDINISPAVIAKSYGKGKVVYTSGGLEALYRTARFKEISQLYDNIINWMSEGRLPYKIFGANGLTVNMTESSNVLLLHLVNNNCGNVKFAPVREEYVPVFDIKACIHTNNRKVDRIKLLYSGAEPEYKVENNILETVIPRIDNYECIAVYFKD
jgi:hypothetical protein